MHLGLGGGGLHISRKLTLVENAPDVSISGSGAALNISIGGNIARGLVLGGDMLYQSVSRPTMIFQGRSSRSNTDAANMVMGLMLEWFPFPTRGFHIGKTFGISQSSASNPNGEWKSYKDGWAGSIRLGYDFWISDEWSMGGSGRFLYGRAEDDAGPDSFYGGALLLSAMYH